MGLQIFGKSGSRSSESTGSQGFTPKPPEPDPKRFTVKKVMRAGDVAIALINYPGCTTYGGDKVLVYKHYDAFKELVRTGNIDPHFLENQVSPIARFIGNEEGWHLALEFACSLSNK